MKDIEPTEDLATIRAAALDYAQGWYTGDAERMTRAVHPALVKRTVHEVDGTWTVSRTSTAHDMVGWTRDGHGAAWSGQKIYDVEVLDIFRDIATVRCLSAEYIDYLHLARFGPDGWRIVNVLWQLREGDYEADD